MNATNQPPQNTVRPNDNALSDANARMRALDTSASFIVRAPAGSGKTTLLTQRYLALLARVAQPEEVLCITFTRKAAAEMRSRVLRALQHAAHWEVGDGGANNQEQPPSDESILHKLASKALAHAKKRSWHLLQNPARLQFYTIDGFCAWLVRRQPHASGFGATPQIEEHPTSLYRQAATEAVACIDDAQGTDEGVTKAAREVLLYFDNKQERVLSLLADMLAVRDQWLWLAAIADIGEQRTLLEQHWDEMVQGELQTLHSAMELSAEGEAIATCAAIAGDYFNNQSDAVQSDVHISDAIANRAEEKTTHDNEQENTPALTDCCTFKNLPSPDIKALRQWCGIANLLLTNAGTLRKPGGITKKNGFPVDSDVARANKEQMQALLERLDASNVTWIRSLHNVRQLPPPKYDDEQWQILNALITLLKQAAAHLNLIIGACGRCDYVAISERANAALGAVDEPSDLALALDYNIHHILVDEFQDTSESQIELLRLLTAGWDGSDHRTLFVVGDPMQSIYAFRRADVSIFLDTAAHGIGQLKLELLTLSTNFRSQKPLIEWVNTVFAEALPARSHAPSGAVAFSPSTFVHSDDKNAVVRFHVNVNDMHPRTTEAVTFVDTLHTELATFEANKARDANIKIAILARNRTHLPDILRALQEAGIPYQKVGLEPLAQRPLVQDLLALARALLHLGDRTAWLAVLRAPWCGLSLSDLERLCSDDNEPWQRMCDNKVTAQLSQDARVRLARIVPVLSDAFAERGRRTPARWIENAWLQLGGAALCDISDWPDARLFFDQLEQLCTVTGFNEYQRLHGHLESTHSLAGISEEEDNAVSTNDETQINPVQVMTMHAAKGLEFDVVLIPGLERVPRADVARLLRWNKYHAANAVRPQQRLLLAPLHALGSGNDAMYDYLGEMIKQKSEYENARLLYVACTRARRRLHLFASLSRSEEDELASPPTRSLLSHIWGSCESGFVAAVDTEKQESVMDKNKSQPDTEHNHVEGHDLDIQTRLCRVTQHWQAPPPAPAINVLTTRDASEHEARTPPTFNWANEGARVTGAIVHNMLCRIAHQGASAWNMQRVRGYRESWENELKSAGLSTEMIKQICTDCKQALQYALLDQRGQWILSDAHHNAHSEYAVSGLVGGRLVRRVIDRMFTADGVCWIIDYKTGSHRGVDMDAFFDNEQQRYRAQLEEYAALVARLGELGTQSMPIRLGLYFPLAHGWREWLWKENGE